MWLTRFMRVIIGASATALCGFQLCLDTGRCYFLCGWIIFSERRCLDTLRKDSGHICHVSELELEG